MSTTQTSTSTTAVANGTAPIPFDFQAISAAEVGVRLDGVEQLSGFTVALNGDGTGTVTPLTSWGTSDVEVFSKPNLTQPANFTRFGAFYPDQFNAPLDRGARSLLAVRAELFAAITGFTGMASALLRSEIAGIAAPTNGRSVFLSEPGATGFFVWREGNFSANVTSDPEGLDYIVSNTVPVTQGAWVREPFSALQPLSPPAGFHWYPPIAIYRSADGVYTTNFNADRWKVPATASIYVATTGNDATGNGTLATPYKTITKAFAIAAGLADTGINVFVAAGEYRTFFDIAAFPNKNINLIATGGRVLMSNKMPNAGPWTLDGAGTYTASLGGWNAFNGVRDAKFPVAWPNGETTPQYLTLAASKAACQATPSTYWLDGLGAIWLHLQDGRVPNADAGQDVGILTYAPQNVNISYTNSLNYVEGFDFEGGSFLAQAGAAVSIGRVVVNNCTHRFTADGIPPFGFVGVALAIVNNCRGFDNGTDTFGYTPRSTGEPPTYAVEISCHSYKSGRTGNTNNGSTNHDTGKTVRVNCTYRDSLGPLCAEVGSVQSWNINVDAQNSLMTSNDLQDACFVCGNPTPETCEMWLESCKSGGSFYDFYVGPGSTIRYRNMVLPASVGGAGTVAPY